MVNLSFQNKVKKNKEKRGKRKHPEIIKTLLIATERWAKHTHDWNYNNLERKRERERDTHTHRKNKADS